MVVTASARTAPALHMADDRRHVVEGDIDAAGNQIVERQRAAAIGDVRHLDIGQPLEQLARQMQRGAVAGRGIGHVALVLVAIGDELLHRFRRLRQRHAHQIGLGDQQRHRREIADRIVTQRRIEEPVGGEPRPDDEDGVTVRIGTGDHLGGDVAAGAGLVLDHHRLAPHLLQPVADQPRGDVGRAARRERHHDAHVPLRPVRRRRRAM